MNFNKKIALLTSLILSFIFSCQTDPKDEKTVKNYAEELHSFANPNVSAINHLDLSINVDFNSETISGKATYTIENNNATNIILDTKFFKN